IKKLYLSKHNAATTKFRNCKLTKKRKRNINRDPEEQRKINVNEERKRREDINEGFTLLQQQLQVQFPTAYYRRKVNKADLLKKGGTLFYSYLQLFGLLTQASSLLAAS
ncbi:27975_t:CDS:1, partial [Gigaspora margarita]